MTTRAHRRDEGAYWTSAQVAAALVKVPFLAKVEPRLLAEHGARCEQVFLPADEVVFEAGAHGNSMYVLLEGGVVLDLPAGFEDVATGGGPAAVRVGLKVLSTTGTGPAEVPWDQDRCWFGESVGLGQTVRPYGARTVEASLLLRIDRARLDRIASVSGQDVGSQLAAAAEETSIELFLLGHRAFSGVSEKGVRTLSERGKTRIFDRGQTIFEQGDSARSVLMIKSGVVKLVRALEKGELTLAFYSPGDIVGTHDEGQRSGALIAMGLAEVVEIPNVIFDSMARALEKATPGWRDQFRRTAPKLPVVQEEVSRGTVTRFVDDLVGDSAQQAQSLMTINLEACIRCGNCVRACESRHGHPKMVRRGKKLTRKYTALSGDDRYEEIMLTSSCRHCESPECMVGCPTGAIHRKETGEVAIHDFCIGCSNCAMRCPWDNITMIPLLKNEYREDFNVTAVQIASKCDLCFGYTEANCVHNCPTQAILRVEPETFFSEVQYRVASPSGEVLSGHELFARRARRARNVILALTALLLVLVTTPWALADSYRPGSSLGFILGAAGFGLFFAAASLSVRRRLAHRGRLSGDAERTERSSKIARGESVSNTGLRQGGAFHYWAKAHLAFGVVGVWTVLLHANFGAHAALTSVLLILTVGDALTGAFGVLFSRWSPRTITRLEGEAQLEEDVEEERAALELRLDSVLESLRTTAPKAQVPLRRLGAWSALGMTEDGRKAAVERFRSRLTDARSALSRAAIDAAAEDAVRRSELRALRALYVTRRVWLGLHIAITAALILAASVHVLSVIALIGIY